MIRDYHAWIDQALDDDMTVQDIAAHIGCTRQGIEQYIRTHGLTPARVAAQERHAARLEVERTARAANRDTERRARILATAVSERERWLTKLRADVLTYTPFLEAGTRPDGKSVSVWGWIKTAWQTANGQQPQRATVTHADMIDAVRAYQARATARHYYSSAEWHRLNLGVSRIVANWRITFSPELQAMFPAPIAINDAGQLVFDGG